MEKEEDVLDKVEPNVVNGHYGNTKGVPVNIMYKNYTAWFKNNYSSSAKPLSFKQWIKWADDRGLVKKKKKSKCEEHNAGGNEKMPALPVEPETTTDAKDEKDKPVLPEILTKSLKPYNTGKFVAMATLTVSVIFIIYNICCRDKKVIAQTTI